MSFNSERNTLKLSISMLSLFCFSQVNAETAKLVQPVSAEACGALEGNSARLTCYDTFFKVPNENRPSFISERQAAQELSVEPIDLKTRFINNITVAEAPEITPKSSLLDSRWELSPESKLGTWNIRAYQPIYLLPAFWASKKNEYPTSPNPENVVGDDEAKSLTSMETKYQLSLKTKAVENIFGNNGDLWLGYTQSSRWQVYNADESRPFRETNYEPEASLMFRTNYEIFGLNGRLLGVTFNHQSNGREDPWSRSWNRVMLNIGLERDNFALMIRPWYRVKEDAKDDNNPDITNYIGRGDMLAFYRYKKHDFSLMLRHSLKGGDDSHGAVRFDWSFPISGKLRGQFQLFDGYGESLIDYNHRATYVGLGVSLMDWF